MNYFNAIWTISSFALLTASCASAPEVVGESDEDSVATGTRNYLSTAQSSAGGNVTSFVEAPLLKIYTNGTELTRTTVVLLAKPNPFGTYFIANKTATVSLKQTDIDLLKAALRSQPGMHIEFKYDNTINTNTSSNALTFTYGTAVIALTIVPKTA